MEEGSRVKNICSSILLNIGGIDYRGLAVLRVAIGIVVILNAIFRFIDLPVFMGDDSTMPAWVLDRYVNSSWKFSLFLINDTLFFQGLMLFLLIPIATLLILGYRTRLMIFLIWILTLSLHSRNPVILNGGDKLFRMTIFWSMFLPLASCCSADSSILHSIKNKTRSFFSIATFAYLLQMVYVYFFTALYKSSYNIWQNGEAVTRALAKDYITTDLGKLLSTLPNYILVPSTHIVLYFEFAIAFMLLFSGLIGWRSKTFSVLLVISLQASFFLSFKIGHFPFVSSIALIPFLPTEFWDRISKVFRGLISFWTMLIIPISISLLKNIISPVKEAKFNFKIVPIYVNLWIFICAVFVLLSNLDKTDYDIPMPKWASFFESTMYLGQGWKMFGGMSKRVSWHSVEAEFYDGSKRNLLEFDLDKNEIPKDISLHYKSRYWRKFMWNLNRSRYVKLRQYFLRYYAEDWYEKNQSMPIKRVRYYFCTANKKIGKVKRSLKYKLTVNQKKDKD